MRRHIAAILIAASLSVWGSMTVWAQSLVTVDPDDIVRTEEVKMKLFESVEPKTVPVTVVQPEAPIELEPVNVYVAVEDSRERYTISEFASVEADCLENVFYRLQEELSSGDEGGNCNLICTAPDIAPEDCIFIFFDEDCKTEYYRISR